MTSVLLGICDELVSNKTLTDWSVNKLGGKPVSSIKANLDINFFIDQLKLWICELTLWTYELSSFDNYVK